MHTRTARGNRAGLALIGLLLLAGGAYLGLRGLAVFSTGQANSVLYPRFISSWLADQEPWIFIVVIVAAVIIGLLALRWLLVQLRTEQLGNITIDTDRNSTAADLGDPGIGRTALPVAALTAAIEHDIAAYPGVRKAAAQLSGTPDRPVLWLAVKIDPEADIADIRTQITTRALTNVHAALDTDQLPTHLQLDVARNATTHRHIA